MTIINKIVAITIGSLFIVSCGGNNSENHDKSDSLDIQIKDTTAILLQPMLSGTELFVGAKHEEKFGHMVLCGLGGIFIEVLEDVNAGLAPLSKDEAQSMIRELNGYGIIKGARGQEGVNEEIFTDIVQRVSALVKVAPEIFEMDLNPLLGKKDQVVAVDARIRIEK